MNSVAFGHWPMRGRSTAAVHQRHFCSLLLWPISSHRPSGASARSGTKHRGQRPDSAIRAMLAGTMANRSDFPLFKCRNPDMSSPQKVPHGEPIVHAGLSRLTIHQKTKRRPKIALVLGSGTRCFRRRIARGPRASRMRKSRLPRSPSSARPPAGHRQSDGV